MGYTKRTKLTAMLLCVLLCLAMTLSCSFIAAKADHDCTGTGCQICEEIENCREYLHTAAAALTVVLVSVLCPVLLMQTLRIYGAECFCVTLVSLKVKLLN